MNQTKTFKALSDPNRLTIMQLVSETEVCANDLLEKLNITQPTLSHHMKVLYEAGLIRVRHDGKWAHYSINYDAVDEVYQYLGAFRKDKSLL
jgi:Predicted transcriptional regulators